MEIVSLVSICKLRKQKHVEKHFTFGLLTLITKLMITQSYDCLRFSGTDTFKTNVKAVEQIHSNILGSNYRKPTICIFENKGSANMCSSCNCKAWFVLDLNCRFVSSIYEPVHEKTNNMTRSDTNRAVQ